MARHGARRRALVLVAGLALATGLMACGGSSDNDPPPAEITPSEAKTSRSDAAALGDPVTVDRAALLTLYVATDGPNWWKSTNWSSAAPLDTWYGVTTNAQGRVTRLVLKTNHLTGPLPTALGDLAHLRELSLWGNHVSGEIPAALGNLAQLRTLALSHNRLQGPIPVELGALGALEVLFLNDNQLRGVLPAGLAARNLRTLYLANNSGLTGCLPEALRAVTHHDLGDTGPTGTSLFWCTFTYDTLDTDGTVTADGSYAFLTTAGDTDSTVGNFGLSAVEAVELRIDPTDADDVDRTTFYDTLIVGDQVDYALNEDDCAFRFRLTSVGTADPRVYGLEFRGAYGALCGGMSDTPTSARDVTFRWHPEPGVPAEDGVRTMLIGEPVTGPGRYRLAPESPVLIDIPAGMTIVDVRGVAVASPGPGAELPDWWSGQNILIEDVQSGAALFIDAVAGKELSREIPAPPSSTDDPLTPPLDPEDPAQGEGGTTPTRDVGALFDAIIQSITTTP